MEDKPEPTLWRIRHPEGQYFVAYLVVYEGRDPTPADRKQLGLIHRDGGPPEDALQFRRERDARQFAEAQLSRDIAWVIQS